MGRYFDLFVTGSSSSSSSCSNGGYYDAMCGWGCWCGDRCVCEGVCGRRGGRNRRASDLPGPRTPTRDPVRVRAPPTHRRKEQGRLCLAIGRPAHHRSRVSTHAAVCGSGRSVSGFVVYTYFYLNWWRLEGFQPMQVRPISGQDCAHPHTPSSNPTKAGAPGPPRGPQGAQPRPPPASRASGSGDAPAAGKVEAPRTPLAAAPDSGIAQSALPHELFTGSFKQAP